MTMHVLKVWPSIFEEIRRGKKTAELRRFDRDFVVGDILELTAWCPEKKAFLMMPALVVQVTHMQHGFGLEPGFVMLSFRRVG